MDLELRHLRVVCAIADAGSVTKAASVLGLAQPALTAQLQRIERALGGVLFERDRRGARATALGELVLARARVLLPAVKGLQDEATRLASTAGTAGRYRIGAVNGPILGGLVHRLTTNHPDAHVSTHASWSAAELGDMVLAGKLDFVLVGACGDAPPVITGLAWRVVAADPVFLLLPEDHVLADRDEVDLAELADAQWVAAPGDGCFSACHAAACARAGFTPKVLFETEVRGAIDLIESGDAVGLCQATLRPMAGLVTAPIVGAPLHWRQMIGWLPDGPAADVAGQVWAYAIEAYADAVRRNDRYSAWLGRHPDHRTLAR
ncbi:LysR family transcriptional regulator [Dactylosporangium roseum]|uniref:LysR family transcriptional regulator n=1 Tax=Dactylosporangium roseum TaxID=47989 RepID=A0ABY5Z298_9ACTN|nr:LysR family transcriptional regulator [Dactylosporangium roseum]UWZ36143.1 LysR family transcriptional regulator [Dactylosporangium roseum]